VPEARARLVVRPGQDSARVDATLHLDDDDPRDLSVRQAQLEDRVGAIVQGAGGEGLGDRVRARPARDLRARQAQERDDGARSRLEQIDDVLVELRRHGAWESQAGCRARGSKNAADLVAGA
jgi:hypothetical protein